jgi:hypothetical protein
MAGGGMSEKIMALQFDALDVPLILTVSSTSVRPGRVRNRTKTELDEKIKKPVDKPPKKTPPARKAPARGRYVDEYARPVA